MTLDHLTSIRLDVKTWWLSCSCGWGPEAYGTIHGAETAAGFHRHNRRRWYHGPAY